MCASFNHFDLRLILPSSPEDSLWDDIIELSHLKRKRLEGTTPPELFYELKRIFHSLESIASARIEGNNTTVAEYIDSQLESSAVGDIDEAIREIQNIEQTMLYIEEAIAENTPINRKLISELHQKLVAGLTPPPQGEGDHTPGMYRNHSVKIKGANHLPPEAFSIASYMDELFDFIDQEPSPKSELLRVAQAHHRFVWIHPFGNGNGRVVRLFTYALLLKYGFNVAIGERIINPTAVFCNDRGAYYEHLSQADLGTNEGILMWCRYVLSGLRVEIEKVDKLCDYSYLKNKILKPALEFAQDRSIISSEEYKILQIAIERQEIQNSDLETLYPSKSKSTISNRIKGLRAQGFLQEVQGNSRKYRLSLMQAKGDSWTYNKLLRAVIDTLGREGFLPRED